MLTRLAGFLNRYTGTTFKFPGMTFMFVIRGGHIMVGTNVIELTPSRNAKYPSAHGWFRFTYMGWTCYITFVHRIQVVGIHGGKVVTGVVQGRKCFAKILVSILFQEY